MGNAKILIQFIKFGLVGGLNTILSYLIYYILVNISINYIVSNFISWFVTVNISFVLNNVFTFSGDNKPSWSIKKLFKVYFSYSFTGLFLSSLLLWFWVNVIRLDKLIAPIINLLITIPLNFVLNKYWAYNNK